MSSDIKGPGILWVTSCIAPSAKDILDETTYLKWYDEDHIAEIMETSGIKNAFRYFNVLKGSSSAPKPYLAFYPMQDLAFTQGPEFRTIKVHSDILPGSGLCYDLADIDVSYLGLSGKTEAKAKKEPAPYILVSGIEPAQETSDESVASFFDQQTEILSREPSYIRTVNCRLLYARSNAQSRKLKGLPSTDEAPPEPPTWQAIHEFSAEPSSKAVDGVKSDPHEVLKNAKQAEVHMYELKRVHGARKFFEE
ncbi:hypothetical protein P154DRAFT_519542 [Amniculicola lignicola CBS 123094]|uniref:Uncharacterized protein n=1 Tax=Amniculicola lignicola CBS 123094 TaxID=1392246 RepID=A0A6A5WRN5_9PLEO|nr:hypothetical protein P154DRAFT_519542 [Amniculicola lignicola CBS 123094]